MNEYTHAAEEMKEMLVTEYLKKNPGLKRAEITTKLVNGRVVVEAVGNVIQNCAGRIQKKVAFSPKEQSILKQLAKNGDERYAECLDSIGTSKKYVSWLGTSQFTGFGEKEQTETLEFLNKRDEIAGKRALDILQAKMKMIQMMKAKVKASKSLVQTLTMEYMQAVTGQLKAQGAIYNREIDLGNTFTGHVEKFIQSNIRTTQQKMDKKTLISVAQAYQLASNVKIDPLDVPAKIDNKEFGTAIEGVKGKLSKLREEFESLQKLISFMESLVEELMKAKDQDLTGEPKPEKENKPSGPRMAFTTRSSRGRR